MKRLAKINWVACLLAIIGLLLLLNLFTPEYVKRSNYARYLALKPQIVKEEVKENYSCPKKITNPEWEDYRDLKYREYLESEEGKKCVVQRHSEAFCLLNLSIAFEKASEGAPPKFLTVDESCEKTAGYNKYLQILGKKIIKTGYEKKGQP